MNPNEIKQMRTKQIVTLNILIVVVIALYFILTSILPITYSQNFFILGILTLGQAIFGLIKRDSTKFIIPIFEQIAKYEKSKMGDEWLKQQRTGHIGRFLLSGIMFWQAYLHSNSLDQVFHIEFHFLIFFVFFILILLNISLWMHIRKIDRSDSELDLKGHTWKSNIKGVILGMIFAFFMIIFTIWFVASRL